jgi:hypothetical protein
MVDLLENGGHVIQQEKVNRSANARPAVEGRPLAHYDTGRLGTCYVE